MKQQLLLEELFFYLLFKFMISDAPVIKLGGMNSLMYCSHILCLFSAAGPHTIVNGKDIVNFTSANYLGLLGSQELLVRFSLLFS